VKALDHPCPTCGAAVGQKCRNYRGGGCAPHRDRGPGRDRERATAHAAQLDAEEAAQFPLLAAAGLLPKHSADDSYWRMRAKVAAQAENPRGTVRQGDRWGADLLMELHALHLGRVARELLLPADFARLDEKRRTTYPAAEYWASFWRDVLSGRKVELAWARDDTWTPSCGRPVVTCTECYQHAHLTPEEFDRRFPGPRDGADPAATLDGDLLADEVLSRFLALCHREEE